MTRKPECPECGEYIGYSQFTSTDGEFTMTSFHCRHCGWSHDVSDDDERPHDDYEDGHDDD